MAVNAAGTLTAANGLGKKVYNKVQSLEPDKGNKVSRRIKYDNDIKLSEQGIVEQVWLTGEHGFTYGTTTDSALTLNSGESATSKAATGVPHTIHFRSRLVIESMSRARAKGDQAFESYVAAMMRNAKRSFDHRVEVDTIYGGASLGSLTSATDAGTSSVFTITAATWAAGLWLGKKNCAIDAYNATDKLNDLADLVITAVNIKNRTLTVSGNATDIDAIVAAGTSVQLYYKGQYAPTIFGVKGICGLSSSSGDYLGIATGDYPDFWNATQVTFDPTAADFTWTKLQDGLEEMFNRGATSDVICEVGPSVWKKLNSSLDALRAFDSSYSVNKVEMGHAEDAITYHSLGFKVTIECNRNVMAGDILVFPDPEDWPDLKRVGSSNISFNLPDGEQIFVQVNGTNQCEYGAFSDQFVWAPAPRQFARFGA